MKKIFCILMIAALCMAFILPTAAMETEEGSVALGEVLEATEGAGEAVAPVETVAEDAETASEQATEGGTPGASSSTGIGGEIESEDIAEIIGSADSRIEAIVGLAGAMGITLEEAEAILDKMVALGDEHLGETDMWIQIRESIISNPEAWTIVVLVVLMLVALAIFLIRGQIKNTSAQAATKANIIDIKKNEAEITGKVNAANLKLVGIEKEHEDIKLEMDAIHAMAEAMLKIVEDSKAEADKIYEMAVLMLSNVDSLKANSESALNVNKEQALQTVQLLNIAMGRQLPRVTDVTRKVWYDDAVARIKTAAGADGEDKTEDSSAPAEQ